MSGAGRGGKGDFFPRGKGWADEQDYMGGWGGKGRAQQQGGFAPPWELGDSGSKGYGKGSKGNHFDHFRSNRGAEGNWAQKGHARSVATTPKLNSNPNKLFVGNLTAEVTSEDVSQALSGAGEIVGVRVLEGKFSGIAFVEFEDPAAVEKAVGSFQGVEICGRAARLERQGGGGPPSQNAKIAGAAIIESAEAESECLEQVSKEKLAPGDQGAGPSIQDADILVESDNHDIAAGSPGGSKAEIADSGLPSKTLSLAPLAPADADAAGGGPAQMETAA